MLTPHGKPSKGTVDLMGLDTILAVMDRLDPVAQAATLAYLTAKYGQPSAAQNT